MTVERRDPPPVDFERRALWLGLTVGAVAIFRSGSPAFAFFGRSRDLDLQISLYAASLIAFGLSVLLCLVLVVPELRSRLGRLSRAERPLFSWAFGFFILGVAITIAAAVEGAIDTLDDETPYA